MEIRCVKGMCGLKVVRSEIKKLGFKGLIKAVYLSRDFDFHFHRLYNLECCVWRLVCLK